LLCIGDAAHAMSPVLASASILAIQDAVAAANILGNAAQRQSMSVDDLRKVQKRREWPVRVTQRLQLMIQKRLIARALQSDASFGPAALIRMLENVSRAAPHSGALIGLGIRPEHVKTIAATQNVLRKVRKERLVEIGATVQARLANLRSTSYSAAEAEAAVGLQAHVGPPGRLRARCFAMFAPPQSSFSSNSAAPCSASGCRSISMCSRRSGTGCPGSARSAVRRRRARCVFGGLSVNQ